MYSSSDFERLFIRYKAEALPSGDSILSFCNRNKVPYNLFEKWYKDTCHKLVPVHVDGDPSVERSVIEESPSGSAGGSGVCPHHGGHPHEQRSAYSATRLRLRGLEGSGRESGGFMLSVNGLGRFYYLRDIHDMRCKYERVLSIIHQQLNREPEDGDVFIVLSKDFRKVRLFSYDRRSCIEYRKGIWTNRKEIKY